MVRVAFAFALFIMVPFIAEAEDTARFALLIGNQAYDSSVGTLKNPHKDIAIVGQALTKLGFQVLSPIKDAKRSVILGGVRELVRRLNTAGSGAIGFIYYSGHGAAEKDTNTNYLIPVDATQPGTSTFWDESLKLDDVLKLLDRAPSAAKFVVFDACRNELQLPSKDTSKGLLTVAEQHGMFIAYASAPGRTASDRGEKSGPYAAALELAKPGLDHLNLFQNVKELAGRIAAAALAQRTEAAAQEARATREALAAAEAKRKEAQTRLAALEEARHSAEARPPGQYNGAWHIRRKGPSCDYGQDVLFLIIITDQVVQGLSAGQQRIGGTLETSGEIRFRHATTDRSNQPDGRSAAYSGTLSGNTGSGSFNIPGTRCKGSFTASRG
jgi:hypothetical protein